MTPRCVVCDTHDYVQPFPTRRELGVCAGCDVEAPEGFCEHCRTPLGDQRFVLEVGDDRFHRPCLRQAMVVCERGMNEDLYDICPAYSLTPAERDAINDGVVFLEIARRKLAAVGYRFTA